ncbi:PREDICTED: uncharacterized protein LOC104800229 [Tarenaya hassleriana]|uniref:uncharacterized protein LOC104800229 n=1 Tax=Tarenaya hassleriana TaxID=28532 RepID=UPI00053C1EBE|nr:PREDICTED: uncharacterized protein LOC104800229 [Tarenaya hassleriana]
MTRNSDISINFHMGGTMDCLDEKLCYVGGLVEKGVRFDSDYLSWFVFEDYVRSRNILAPIHEMWYKLPHQNFEELQKIEEDIDWRIYEMCQIAKGGGELDIFIDHELSEDASYSRVFIGGPLIDEGSDWNENEGLHKNVVDDEGLHENIVGLHEVDIDGVNDDRFERLVIEGATVNDEERRNATEYVSDDDDLDNDDVYPDTPLGSDNERDETCNPQLEKTQSGTRRQPSLGDHFYLGKTFRSGEEFRQTLMQYVLDEQFNVQLSRWEHDKYAVVCKNKDCSWRLYCSVEKPINKWMVKVLQPDHNHKPNGHASMLTMREIAKLFIDDLRREPAYTAVKMQHQIKKRYNLTVSISKCFKARRIGLQMVTGDQKTQIAKLWDYEAELRRSNPNTSTEIGTTDEDDRGEEVFDRFYVCFEVLRTSWKQFCRPVIGLDGCFLKWDLKGELLAAVGRDANNRIYPIAWAVVRIESNDTRAWFIRKLKSDLCLGDGEKLTILSDKQKGLLNAIEQELPHAEHRMCARHIYANWKKTFKDMELKLFFWKAAQSYHQGDYTQTMDALKAVNPLAHDALIRTEPHHWARAFFKKESQCRDVHNNLSESFNKSIRDARSRPVVDMLEEIRRQTMARIAKRSKDAEKCITEFSPKAMSELEQSRDRSRHCLVIPSGHGRYEVLEFGISYAVNLSGNSCACRKWDLTGIPCQHALSIINERQENISRFISTYHSKANWVATYAGNILPVNGEPLWKKTLKFPIGVPEDKRMPGRPKKFNRKKDPHESPRKSGQMTRHGRKITCKRCQQVGHNSKTCKNDPVQTYGPQRGRGRPRKLPLESGQRQNKKGKTSASISQTATNTVSSNQGTIHPPQSNQTSQVIRPRLGFQFHRQVNTSRMFQMPRQVFQSNPRQPDGSASRKS